MSLQPQYAQPEPRCYLSGSVLHVEQAMWRQTSTFFAPPPDSKWCVGVYVAGALVYGTNVPNFAGTNNTTSYTGEMPITQTEMSVDLAAYGVHSSHPLTPVVRVVQSAGFKNTTGWWWYNEDWEGRHTPLSIYIDSYAGIPQPLTFGDDASCPLYRCYYDEGAPEGDTWTYSTLTNTDDPDGNAGLQFQAREPGVTIDGIQTWVPPDLWDEEGGPPDTIAVRLWKNDLPANEVLREVTAAPNPGWNNLMFDESVVATYGSAGWYTVGVHHTGGKFWSGGGETTYKSIYPEHEKVYTNDNYTALSQLTSRGAPPEEKGPEWAPRFGGAGYFMVGPILTYVPVYPEIAPFVPQIYRRVVTEAV